MGFNSGFKGLKTQPANLKISVIENLETLYIFYLFVIVYVMPDIFKALKNFYEI